MDAVYDEDLDETAVDDSKEETYFDFDMNESEEEGEEEYYEEEEQYYEEEEEYYEVKLPVKDEKTPVTGYFDRFISLT